MISVQQASSLTLYAVVIVAVVQDMQSSKISNRLIFTAFLLSLVFGILSGGAPRVVQVLLNSLIPVILLYLLYLPGVLGAGDIKLFSIICGFTNLKTFIDCLFASFLAGAVVSVIKLIKNRNLLPSLLQAMQFIRCTASGSFSSYRREWAKPENLMHFSAVILPGLIFAQTIAR